MEYYTIRGMHDLLFWGCKYSPELVGAEENVVIPGNHDDVRRSRETKESHYRWLTDQNAYNLDVLYDI